MMQSNHDSSNYRNGNLSVPPNGNNGGTLVPLPAGGVDPMSAGAAAPAGGQMEAKALINAFRRRWFVAVTVGLFCGGTAAAAVFLLVPPEFVAESVIYIKATPTEVLAAERNPIAFDTFKKTQMFRAIGRLVLTSALSEPVENQELKKLGYKTIADLPLLKSQPFPEDWLQTKLSASGRNEEFFGIVMTNSENPEQITEIVNAVTNVYLRDVANEDKKAKQDQIKLLDEAFVRLNKQIQLSENNISKYSKRVGGTSAEATTALSMANISVMSDLQRERNQLWLELNKLRYMVGDIDKADEAPQTDETAEQKLPANFLDELVEGHEEVRAQKDLIERLEEQIVKLEDTIVDENDRQILAKRKALVTAKEELASLKVELRPVVEKQMAEAGQQTTPYSLADRMKLMRETLAKMDADLEKQKIESEQRAEDTFELDRLRTELNKFSVAAADIESRSLKIKIELDAPNRIKLERKAEVPRLKDMTSLYKKCAMAGFGVFGLLVAGIVWFEFQAKRIDSLSDVTSGLNLRIMGALPSMPSWAGNKKKPSKAKAAKSAFWHSVLTESIDATRTVLIRDANVESTRMVMVGSAISGEGKTTLSCHLAASLARVGRQTLLVDCDFRRSNVHKVFGLEAKPGLSEVLLGTATLEEAIQFPQEDGPAVLPAGDFNSQLLSALAQDGLGSIFQELRKQFEFIIVDSSPILPVTDSLMVAQHVDAVIFSIRRDISRRPKVVSSRDRLAMLGVPILGAVVIGLDGESYGYRNGYYGYGSKYGYGYQYNRTPEATTKS